MSWTETARERAALIEAFSEAWAAGDLDGLMQLMSDDCFFRASVGPEPGTTFRGREEVRRGFGLFLPPTDSRSPAPETIVEEPLICDEFAVTRWTTSSRGPEGQRTLVRACDVFGFEGGRIKFKDTYRKVSESSRAAD